MKRSIILTLLLAASFGATGLQGQVHLNKLAQSTMNFLLVSTSPAASGMGEAGATLMSGAESMFYNPAGLAGTPSEFDLFLNVTQWIADIRYISSGAAWNLGSVGTVGLTVLAVDYGTIQGTVLVSAAEQSQYPLGYKDTGPVGNLGAYAFGVAYARSITDLFSIGGSVRYAAQSLGENLITGGVLKKNDAQKFVYDAGVRYNTGFRSFRFAMAIRNFASDVKREEIEETLPLVFDLGLALEVFEAVTGGAMDGHSLTIAVDFLHQNNYSERANVGAVYTFQDMVSLRGGYQTNRDLASWSAGIGIAPSFGDQKVRVDYSYSRFRYFGGVNRFGIGVNL